METRGQAARARAIVHGLPTTLHQTGNHAWINRARERQRRATFLNNNLNGEQNKIFKCLNFRQVRSTKWASPTTIATLDMNNDFEFFV